MVETPEIIRQQMDETKSQLSEKLESLELQVSETVQSTGTAVNATVEAVQVTVETITDAVHEAARFATNACDIRRHVERHPLLTIGSSFVLGYLATEVLMRRPKLAQPLVETAPSPSVNGDGYGTVRPSSAADVAAAYESGRNDSSSFALKGVAINALVAVIQTVASHAVPRLMDYLLGKLTSADTNVTERKRFPAIRNYQDAT
jgi:hypothetical protein